MSYRLRLSATVVSVATLLAVSAATAHDSHDHSHADDHKHEEHAHDHDHDHDDHRQHGAHVHGISTMNVAQSGSDLLIELMSPSANIVGFEYMPETEAEITALTAAVATLEASDGLFELPSAAQCSLVEANVEGEQLTHMAEEAEHDHSHDDHAHDHNHDHAEHKHDDHDHAGHNHSGHDHSGHDHAGHDHDHDHGTHSEIHASYLYTCGTPTALDEIHVNVFSAFPGTEQINVQFLSDSGQNAFTLTADETHLHF